jgi:sRNA-binding regulator protein Hfq
MAFTNHQNRCMLEIYFRNGVKIDGQWVKFTRNAFEDFQESSCILRHSPEKKKYIVLLI